jgi:hypothetical protein
MLGNEAATDALGFLNPSKQNKHEEIGLQHLYTRIQSEMKTGTVKNL